MAKYMEAYTKQVMLAIVSYFSLVFAHSKCPVYTTDSLLSYVCTVVSVCQGLFLQLIHCSHCLDMTFQPFGTHLSYDPTSAKGIQLYTIVIAK